MNRFFCMVVLFASSAVHGADAICLNYELFDHLNAPVAVEGNLPVNQASVGYAYPIIHAQHLATPPLGHPNHSIGVSLGAGGVWHHAVHNLGGRLTLQEAALLAIDREDIGIEIDFLNYQAIFLVAAGMNPGGDYPRRALVGGGYYRSPLAAFLYRLRYNPAAPNFLVLPAGAVAQLVIVHIHTNLRRVSKNAKELSFNSVLNPALADVPPYISLKSIINGQHAVGAQPDSATILSSSSLQVN